MRLIWVLKKDMNRSPDAPAFLKMARELRRLGWDVSVWAMGGKGTLSVPARPKPILRYWDFTRWVRRLLSTADPRAVLMVGYEAGWLGVSWARAGRRVVMDIRTLPTGRGALLPGLWADFWLSLRLASRLFSGLSFITEAIKEFVARRVRITKPYTIWQSGVDLDLFRPEKWREAGRAVRSRLGLGDGVVFAYWGTFGGPERGGWELVGAVGELGKAKLLLVCPDAPKELPHWVVSLPPVAQSQLPAYLAAADFAVLPFRDTPAMRTSSPLKLLEALAMGMPVVATDIRAIRDVLAGRDFWVRAEPGRLAEALALAARKRGQLVALARREARALAEPYSWQNQAKKLSDFLWSLSRE